MYNQFLHILILEVFFSKLLIKVFYFNSQSFASLEKDSTGFGQGSAIYRVSQET